MTNRPTSDDPRNDSERLGPDDPRYRAVLDKQFNKRFRARPDYVRVTSSTDHVIDAIDEALREGRRLVVTSGGHCLEGFVSDPEARGIIDIAAMKRVYWDAELGAVAVGGGAPGGRTLPAVLRPWGVRAPPGEEPGGGHGG